jgi:hypothetical protein
MGWDWRFWSNLNVDFNAKYNPKCNVHAMLHPSLVGSVVFLEYTWNTFQHFQHWIAFYGMSQKPRKLAGGQHCHSQSQKTSHMPCNSHSDSFPCFSFLSIWCFCLFAICWLFASFPSLLSPPTNHFLSFCFIFLIWLISLFAVIPICGPCFVFQLKSLQ